MRRAEPAEDGHDGKGHIVAVRATDEPSKHRRWPGQEAWTVEEVIAGYHTDIFYTHPDGKGPVAVVGYETCHQCDKQFLRTHPDDTKINNLDSLPDCE